MRELSLVWKIYIWVETHCTWPLIIAFHLELGRLTKNEERAQVGWVSNTTASRAVAEKLSWGWVRAPFRTRLDSGGQIRRLFGGKQMILIIFQYIKHHNSLEYCIQKKKYYF